MRKDSGPNLPPFPSSYRASGLLLHVTSLPSSYGIGDVGPAAIAWIHQLSDAGQSWWQALPLGPTGNAGENPWRRWIDTALDSPHDILEWAKAEPLHGYNYRADSRSMVMLYRYSI